MVIINFMSESFKIPFHHFGGLRMRGGGKKILFDKPLITVVTVVYNHVKHLEEAIKSVINQAYQNVEYIIIDGGSTDGTLDVIKKYEHVIDYWISEPDGGIYNAMNKGLNIASGDWLIFLGADDVLADCLVSVSRRMKRQDVVYYGNAELASSGKLYAGSFNRYKLMQQNICHQAIFYPRSIYLYKRYEEEYRWLADYKYNMDLWGDGVRFCYIPEKIARFNDLGASSSGDIHFNSIKMNLILKKLGFIFWLIKGARNFFVLLVNGQLKL